MSYRIAIVYFSGAGHTARVAEHVRRGAAAQDARATVELFPVTDFPDAETGPWDRLLAADAIIFGSPTYMGAVAAAMKAFMDATAGIWYTGAWTDKLAAGFANSGSPAGDKLATLQQFSVFAAQHAMTWVNFGAKPEFAASTADYKTSVNRTGHFLGLGTHSANDLPAEETPDAIELETAERFGARVARITGVYVAGRAAVAA